MEKLKEILAMGAIIASVGFFGFAAVYLNLFAKNKHYDPDEYDGE